MLIKFLCGFICQKSVLQENRIYFANLSLVLIFLLIHGHDAKAILRDDGIYLANLRGTQNVVIGLLVSKIYPDKKIGNLFNRATGEKENLWKEKFILLETEADEVVMGWFSQIAVSEFSPPEDWLLSYGAVFPYINSTTIHNIVFYHGKVGFVSISTFQAAEEWSEFVLMIREVIIIIIILFGMIND